MREFIIKRLTYEWFQELQNEIPNEDKLKELSKLLEKLEPIEWEQRFEKKKFFEEHIRRRNQVEKQKKTNRHKMITKAAIIILVASTSLQAVCYAVTRKSIFYYLNEMKNWVQTIEYRFKSDEPSIKVKSTAKEDEIQESESVTKSTWKEAIKISNRKYVWPRVTLRGWQQEDIQVEILNGTGDIITTTYTKKEAYFSFMMMYETGNGGGITEYSGKRKKIKEVHQKTGDYFIYQGEDGVSVEGFYDHVRISVDGELSVEEATKLIESIR